MNRRSRVCKACGHSNLSVDHYTPSGEITCNRCGVVQDENPIVSEVQFGESASGAATVQGTMVGADQARAPIGGRQNAMESREQTLMKGRRKIKRLAIALKIPDYIAEEAGNRFNLALTNNFVQGRRSQNVLAACLYVACRKEKTRHMLIDFSSALQISVFSLGATFLKLVKALHITQIPLADPSLFIEHFAEHLEFKEHKKKVVRDAVKIAQQMSIDWIHEGRRPAGIAGACLLLAARMNNFRRSHAEIVAVAHVGEETIQRRLNEFKNTQAGNLSISLFRQGGKIVQSLPPSYQKNRKKEKVLADEVLAKTKVLKRLESLKYFADSSAEAAGEVVEVDSATAEAAEEAEEAEGVEGEDAGEDANAEETNTLTSDDANANAEQKQSRQQIREAEKEAEKEKLLRTILSDCDISEDAITRELTKILNRKKDSLNGSLYMTPSELENVNDADAMVELNRPRNLVANHPTTSDMLEGVNSNVELNSDDDDEETLAIKLTPDEIALKERIWTGLNHDFLIAQEKKRLKLEADELTGNTSSTKRKRKSPSVNENDPEYKTALKSLGVDAADDAQLSAADSAKQMISKKAFSKKINYSAMSTFLETSKTTFG